MMIETAMPQLDITQVFIYTPRGEIYTPRGVILGVYSTGGTYHCHLQLFVVKATLSLLVVNGPCIRYYSNPMTL
jgi:hypothetical protein